MGEAKKVNVQKSKKSRNGMIYLVIFMVIFLAAASLFMFKDLSGRDGKTASTNSEDIKIVKSEISETAKFYPYKVGNTKMEVLAIKAKDGTIRTAFNTCQVCYGSGKGYYKQEGDALVCQNCGNRFKAEQVEKIKGGCNPVPITKENKTEDETTIKISKDFLKEAKEIFANWKS